MSNVAHATLTGSDIHEPKGITSASLGTAYIANGSGSGSWQNVGTSSFTGMIADFVSPVAPTGWLELDGSIINTTTFAGLYAVMTITTTGTRANSSPVVTSIADTSQFSIGYFAYGTGIIAGTTIVSIDSASQITLSNNSTSSGTATFAISPWALNNGTIQLPDLKTAGRYRRSRTSGSKIGDIQATQNLAHSHTGSLTTGNQSNDHTHTYSGTTGSENQSHNHNYTAASAVSVTSVGTGGGNAVATGSATSGTENQSHQHAYSGTTSGISTNHTHSVTIPSDGASEARPVTLVVMTCVKT